MSLFVFSVVFSVFAVFSFLIYLLFKTHFENNKINPKNIQQLAAMLPQLKLLDANLATLIDFKNYVSTTRTKIQSILNRKPWPGIDKIKTMRNKLPDFSKCVQLKLDTFNADIGMNDDKCSGLNLKKSLACGAKNLVKKQARDLLRKHVINPIEQNGRTRACASQFSQLL
tara:strand:- start:587 stop:1096 length:510 start_codon:yes stop_codon:yes gene_type:complete